MNRLLYFALSLASCAAPVDHAPSVKQPESVNKNLALRLDASLSVDYQSAVIEAALQWSTHGFDVPVSIVDGSLANVLVGDCPERAAGCAWPRERIHFVPDQLEACNWTRVDGVTQCAPMPLKFMVTHEVGHFLGINHHLPDGNLMQVGVTHPMPPAEPTAADVAALQKALSSTIPL